MYKTMSTIFLFHFGFGATCTMTLLAHTPELNQPQIPFRFYHKYVHPIHTYDITITKKVCKIVLNRCAILNRRYILFVFALLLLSIKYYTILKVGKVSSFIKITSRICAFILATVTKCVDGVFVISA